MVTKAPAAKPIKAMNPRTADASQMGPEPDWSLQPTVDARATALTKMFVWYNYFYGKKEAKECIIDFLSRNNRVSEAKAFAKVSDSSINTTLGWVCRASLRGLELTESELVRVNEYIKKEIAAVGKSAEMPKINVTDSAIVVVSTPTIQDRLKERVVEAAGELEGIFDEFVKNGAKLNADVKPLSLLRTMNVAPQMVSYIKDVWNKKLDEFNLALAGKESQLVEGYSQFGKIQLRALVKFAELVIADCDSYVQLKKADRKPRAKKAVSPEKLSARFKVMREFPELKIKSESAAKLVGATEAWLYDTKKRKLIHVVADQHAGTFTVKGASIVGFDTTNSVQKTLRKPADQIKGVMGNGKPAARKFFKEIKSTEVKFNGRSNENIVILKVW